MTMETEPTRVCAKCGGDCARGWVESWKGEVLVQTVCTDCDRAARYDTFERTGRLHSWLISDAALTVFYAEEAREKRDPGPRRLALAHHGALHALRDELVQRGGFDGRYFVKNAWFSLLQMRVELDDALAALATRPRYALRALAAVRAAILTCALYLDHDAAERDAASAGGAP